VAGKRTVLSEEITRANHALVVDGVTYSAAQDIDFAATDNSINIIAGQTTQNYFQGIIKGLTVTDHSGIQARPVTVGDGIRWCLLDSPVSVNSDAWSVSFDMIRYDNPGAAFDQTYALRGDLDGVNSISWFNSTHGTTPDRISFACTRGGTIIGGWDGALTGVQIGQHVHIEIVADGADISLYRDGELIGSPLVGVCRPEFDRIGADAAATDNKLGPDAAVANIQVKQGGTVISDLPLDDEMGTVAVARKGPGGTWTDDQGKKGVPNNSRYYPMDEGSGNTFFDDLNIENLSLTVGNDGSLYGAINPEHPGATEYGLVGGWATRLTVNATGYTTLARLNEERWNGAETVYLNYPELNATYYPVPWVGEWYAGGTHVDVRTYLEANDGQTVPVSLSLNTHAVIANFSSVGPGWVFPYQQESRKVMARMSSLSGLERAAIDQFVRDCLADGNWLLLDEFYCFALNGTDWLTGWKAHTATTQGSVTRTPNGAQCNNTASHIDTQIVPSAGPNYTLSNAEAGVFIQTAPDWGTSNVDFFGVESAAASRLRWRHRGNDNNDTRPSVNSSATISSTLLVADISGKLHSVRGLSGTRVVMEDGVVTGTHASAPEAIDDASIHLFRANMSGPQSSPNGGVISVFYSGAELDTVAFEGRVRALLAQLNVFLVGGP
jgi:hypothetical protein